MRRSIPAIHVRNNDQPTIFQLLSSSLPKLSSSRSSVSTFITKTLLTPENNGGPTVIVMEAAQMIRKHVFLDYPSATL